MHISITGDLGSGKSTVAKEICRVLNYKYLSMGQLQRQLGQERGMNTLEFNKFTDNNKEIDDYIDQRLKDVNTQTDSYVLDSRLGWHFVKTSFKVYLMAVDEVSASRVLVDEKRIGEPLALDIKAKIKEQSERRKIESARFEKNYGVKPSIFKDFDVIIDTSSASISEVTSLILSLYEKYKKTEYFNKIWLSPHRIFPTENIRLIASEEAKAVKANIKENGFNSEYPVSCVLFQKEFYMFDGHKRLSACLYNKLPFIPIVLIAKNEDTINPTFKVEQFIKDTLNISWIYDWEDAHDFRFYHYPAILELNSL
jgi:CMP/dCMP kinase